MNGDPADYKEGETLMMKNATFIDTCIAVNSLGAFSIHRDAERALEETTVGVEVSWILKSYQDGALSLTETVCKLYEQMVIQLD